MITVCASQFGISAGGHAGTAPEGHDIVCAAFTMLMNTAAESVRRMELEGKLYGSTIVLENGNAIVVCNPIPEYYHETETVFNTIKAGIDILCEDYPKSFTKKY